MSTDTNLLRWHWRVNTRAPLSAQFEFRLDDLHTAADPVRFVPEGHHLSLTWSNPLTPMHTALQLREKFITEEFRQDSIRLPFWVEQITDNLSVTVALAKPQGELGDDVSQGQVLRVSYTKDGDEWLVAPVAPAYPYFSRIVAVQPI